MFSLWVMAKSGAARYFESAFIRSPPFIAFCLSAGHGVPLHTLYPSGSQRGSVWRMAIRLSRNMGKPIKKPLTFPKEKVRGLHTLKNQFSMIFLSFVRILIFRLCTALWFTPSFFASSLSERPSKNIACINACSLSDNKFKADLSLSNIIL